MVKDCDGIRFLDVSKQYLAVWDLEKLSSRMGCAQRKLRWSFQKLSMPIARMSCPRPGDQRLPHTNSFLARHLPISSSSTQFYRCFEAQHLFISLQTASKQIVAFQRCTLNVSPSAGDPSRVSNDKYQDLGALGGCDTGCIQVRRAS